MSPVLCENINKVLLADRAPAQFPWTTNTSWPVHCPPLLHCGATSHGCSAPLLTSWMRMVRWHCSPPPLSHGAMFGPNKISHNKVNTNNIIHSLLFIYHLTPHIIKCLWQFYYWTSIRGEYQPLRTPSCIVLRPDKTLSWGGESRVRIFDISPILRSLGDETAVICKSNSFIPDITMLNQTPHIL